MTSCRSVSSRSGPATSTPASGSVSVDVVRENGRWFVSPVTTVLKALDATVQHIDERTVYTLLGLGYELPPDGTITLNEPFTPPPRTGFFNSSIYAFDGTKGQEVVGEIAGTRGYASGQIYTSDGKEVDYVDFSPSDNGYAYSVTLPATGSYRLVLSGGVPKDAKLTLWDTKDAPKGLLSGPSSSSQQCFTQGGGVSSCSSSGSSSSGDFACAIKNNALACTGTPPIPICAPKQVPNAAGDCITADDAKSMIGVMGASSSSSSKSVTATTGVATSVP